jgi:hypothetical protein
MNIVTAPSRVSRLILGIAGSVTANAILFVWLNILTFAGPSTGVGA